MFTRALVFGVLLTSTAAAFAQPASDTRYLSPPQAIVDILDAPPLPSAVVAPSRDAIVLLERKSMPSIAELAQPMLRLAGRRLNPATSAPHRLPDVVGLVLKPIGDGAERRIATPEGAALSWIGFSPDGRHFAFIALTTDRPGVVWIGSTGEATASEVAGMTVNASLSDRPCRWFDDGRQLACTAIPEGRGAPPAPPAAPGGPNIQEHAGQVAPVRTYQDLLTNADDEALFEYHASAQVVLVDATRRSVRRVGGVGLVASVEPSPDGRFLLVERLERPFSRLVPAGAFPTRVEVWNVEGTMVRPLAERPLADAVPIGGVPTGPRDHRWESAAPATVVWTEALDGGDPRADAAHRDRLVRLVAPFTGEPVELMKTAFRVTGLAWTDRGLALVSESDRPTRRTRTWMVAADAAPACSSIARRKMPTATRARRSRGRAPTGFSRSAPPSTSRGRARRRRAIGRFSTGWISRPCRPHGSSAATTRATRPSSCRSTTRRGAC